MKPFPAKAGIYRIWNKVSSKSYIGSATNIAKRWTSHRRLLRQRLSPNLRLQAAWNKYGESQFVFEVVEAIALLDPQHIADREQSWIDYFGSTLRGYNIRKVAISNLGLKHSLDARKKMSAAHRGRTKSEDHKRKIGESQRGRVFSELTKRKMSASAKGKVISEEHKSRLRAAGLGRHHSEETRARTSAALRGRPFSAAHLRNIKIAQQRRRAREHGETLELPL